MADLYNQLPKPFFILAPMDDVTDTVFRQIIAECAPPDLFFTEFVNVDALQSKGREATLPRLRFTDKERPIIAQIWGKNPENFHKTAKEFSDGSLLDEINRMRERSGLSNMLGSKDKRARRTDGTLSEPHTRLTLQIAKNGSRVASSASEQAAMARMFAGIDLNFGCPDKNVVRNGTCSAFILPENRERAVEIIQATKEGMGSLPLSVKTRLGFSDVDLTWHELLLKQKLNMLTIHGRTKEQMSKIPADWAKIGDIRELRDKLSPDTLVIGNGDVMTRTQGIELAEKYRLDGIMIGRGIFHDPFVFSEKSPWKTHSKEKRIALYRKHVKLFAKTYEKNERNVHVLNKFCKIYINGFDGAKELREKLMAAKSTDMLMKLLQ